MYNASSDFREKAVDGTTPQNVILAFDNLYFSGNDGDFADSGVTFEQFFNTAEDLSFGEAPSDTLDFTVMNDTGALATIEYGDAQAYFGVRTDTEEYTMPEGVNAHIEYEGVVFEGKDDGLYAAGGGYGSTTTTESAESVTFDSPYEAPLQSVLVTLTPQQSGSGTPSPTNVRPITGTESVTVTKVGKNLLPRMASGTKTDNGVTFVVNDDGSVTMNGTATANSSLRYTLNAPVKLDGEYIVNGINGGSSTTWRFQYKTVDKDGTVSGWIYVNQNEQRRTFNGVESISDFRVVVLNGTTVDNVTVYPMIRRADDTDQTYEPYIDESVTTDLGRTVYAGTVDLVTGKLTVTHGYLTLQDYSSWTGLHTASNGVKRLVSGPYLPGAKASLSNLLQAFATQGTASDQALNSIAITGDGRFVITPSYIQTATSAAEAKSILMAQDSVQLVYELATPETYQLTPEQIIALLGGNTVTSGAGNVQVEYVSGTGSTGLIDGKVLGLLGTNDKVYAVGEYASVVIEMPPLTASEYTPNRFMVEKMQSGKGAVFSGSAATVWRDGAKDSWEYIPMGKYQVERPANNLALTVKVNDAHDYMTKFDADASAFIESIEYPVTIGGIYTALCDFVGVEYESATFTGSDVELAVSPFPDTSTTLRGVLKWIAERAFSVAHFDRDGVLKLYWLGSTVAEEIQPDNIAWDKATFADYDTQMVTSAIVKDSAGATLTFGHGDNPYVIAGNPFVSTLSASELTTIQGLPEFTPLNVEVIYPSPCTDVGDFVSVQPKESTRQVLMDVYQRVFANEDNEAYAIEIAPYTVPLMSRTMTFTGWLYGRYVATGNRKRIYDLDNAAYNASISIAERIDRALTPTEVFNKLTDNGRIQGLYMVDGQIYVNAEYIKAGILSGVQINNGNGTFSVSENGDVTAANLNITGGQIDMRRDGGQFSVIRLANHLELTPEEYPTQTHNVDSSASLYSGSLIIGRQSYVEEGGVEQSRVEYTGQYDAISAMFMDSNGETATLGTDGLTMVVNGYVRVRLDTSGLYFYNASGTLTKSYPAT